MTKTLAVRVARKWDEAEDICALELVDSVGGSLPAYDAGSHIDVRISSGIVRQYSLARAHSNGNSYEIAVLRDPKSRGGSAALCDSVSEGDLLQISEPRNCFSLVPAKHSVLLAGGIGITPILCMAETLHSTQRTFELHYCARSAGRMAFRQRIADSSLASHASFHLDDGAPVQKLDLAKTLGNPETGKHLYVCGPGAFLEFVRSAAKTSGWAHGNVHFEYFAAPSDRLEATSGVFEVVVASTGRSVVVAENESIVAALSRCGT